MREKLESIKSSIIPVPISGELSIEQISEKLNFLLLKSFQEFIDYILSNHPYKDYKKDEINIEEDLKKNKKKLIRKLLRNYRGSKSNEIYQKIKRKMKFMI